jgi:NhaP-type Na+/H+ or K+/H+ antiporter
MEHHALVEIGVILGLAAAAFAMSARLRVPAIITLVVAGFIAGPVLGLVHPDALLGDLLLPMVSVAVAVILFEGALTLRLRELRGVGSVVVRLLTVGVLLTWLLTAVLALWLLGTPWSVSLLIGAVLVVSGPTVVLPILRRLRLRGGAGSALRWEGIVIDPIGVILAVVVFQAIVAGQRPSPVEAIGSFAMNIAAGAAVGVAMALALVLVVRRGRLDEHTEVVVTLAAAVLAFAAANAIAPESGLVTVTLMGAVLANQPDEQVHHIHAFKQSLGLLLTGVLFIVLTARVPRDLLFDLGLAGVAFLLALVLVVRPLVAWVCTIGSRLDWRERVLIGAMAPRGIVAASTASVFAIALQEHGSVPGADRLAPAAFVVIVGSVIVYGLGAPVLARRLGLSGDGPGPMLIVGADPWTRALARTLADLGVPVLVWAPNPENAATVRGDGVPVIEVDLLSDEPYAQDRLPDIERALVVTANDPFNARVVEALRAVVPDERIDQIASGRAEYQRARAAFGPERTWDRLDAFWSAGARMGARAADEVGARPGDLPLVMVAPGRPPEVIQGTPVDDPPARARIVVLGPDSVRSGVPREPVVEPVGAASAD